MNTHSGKADVINRSTNIVQNGTVIRKKNVEDRYKSLNPEVKEYREPTDIAGLYCRVQPNGKNRGNIVIKFQS